MTIRLRMTLWYSGVLLLSTVLIAVLSYDELHERHERNRRTTRGMEEILGIMLWVGVPAVVLSVAGGWWLMRKALAPVGTLTEAAQRVNERTLTQELPRTHNGDELDRLAEVLNAMTARLNDSFTRVRDFTLHASHELKTPLTVLCGETETELRDESLAPAERERVASRLDELRRLTRIVDGLTLLAKADAGLIQLKLTLVHLDELVRDIFADTLILAESAGLAVHLPVCTKIVVNGEPHRLRQLLLNLADNAVKYNQPGGSITMALSQVNEEAEFTISNTGPGIAPEALPRVFDRFFRGDAAHSQEVEGCGLGLSIAQWIVNAHQGSIRIESTPAKLTTVTVCLPIAQAKPDVC
ncbi:Integral membrane sensor signal transduction histidine kinase [Verrucomicrobia bacterium]|nr:Integral membrane sensor signal transduction histidine kinase [Verrucomicrobiota bacterium]